jgi:Protein of unknown function (DUF998)
MASSIGFLMRSALPRVAVWLRPAGWPALPDHERARVRALSWLAISPQVLFIAGWIVGWALEPNYSPVRDYVSELGRRGATNSWIFDVSIALWGAGFITLALALLTALRTRPWARVAPALFVLAGVCAILDAPLRLDCASSMNLSCRARMNAGALSWQHYGHVWAAFGIEVALMLTPFALARSTWPSRLSRLLLYGAIAVGLVLGASSLINFEDEGLAGLWQRIELLITHLWIVLCAATLILQASPERPTTTGRPRTADRAALPETTASTSPT